ncbi:hypothetical protein, partial [Escherichia coli]
VSVVTLVWGISPRQPSGKNIIRWLLKKRTNGSVRYCQYTSYRYGTLPCPSWHNNINQRLFKPTPQMHFFMN